MTAYEQAELLFTGWMRSCWSCLSPGEESSLRHQKNDGGMQREMEVCQTQPHLVPPMKLVVRDDLSGPGVHHQQRNSLSSWVMEGRNLASRASMTLKRHSTAAPLKIGAPMDFRRVQSFHPQTTTTSTSYHPLELRIHQSGNRLSDLPTFDSFQLDEDPLHRKTLAVPPRTLAPSDLRSRRCQSTASAVISRKPVGSGNRRSWGSYEPVIQQPPPARIASTLIPHFSIVNPVEPATSGPPVPSSASSSRSGSAPSQHDVGETELTLNTEWPGQTSVGLTSQERELPQTPRVTKNVEEDPAGEPFSTPPLHYKNSPSSASSRTLPSRISSLRRPSISPTEKRKTIASFPSLSNRVTQWFFPSKAASPRPSSLADDPGFAWERTRTLSGSTMASTVTTITGGTKARRPNTSISSTFTNASTPRTSLRGPSPMVEKELDVAFSHPTIYEGRQQHYSGLTT